MTTKTSNPSNTGKASKQNTFGPLIVDVAVPVGSYYLFKDACGTSTFTALALSSVVPAVRTLWSAVKDRRTNSLAALILAVNVVSLSLSFLSGDPRLMLAKDSGVSSVIGIAILVSVAMGRPMMTEGFKPFLTRGDAVREAAWERLAAGSAAFRRLERLFSLVWGVALLAECAARIVGAYTVPVDTMVWLGSVILAGTIALALFVSRKAAAEPLARMLSAEVNTTAGTVRPEVAVAA
jgi:intracellular septation protein A